MITADRINLLPGFVAARRRARRLLAASTTVALAAAMAAGLVFVTQGLQLRTAQDDLALQKATNAVVASEVARLADVEAMQARLVATDMAIDQLLANEVRWSLILADLQAVVPADTWLTGMTVTVAPEPGYVGKIDFQGATRTHPDVADWLGRLGRIPGFAEPYFSVSTKNDVEGRQVVSFSSSVRITEAALRRNQPGAAR